MTSLDVAATIERRVWLRCTPCREATWLYLLEASGRFVWVQCPTCLARYWLDTRCGVGRPGDVGFNEDILLWT